MQIALVTQSSLSGNLSEMETYKGIINMNPDHFQFGICCLKWANSEQTTVRSFYMVIMDSRYVLYAQLCDLNVLHLHSSLGTRIWYNEVG